MIWYSLLVGLGGTLGLWRVAAKAPEWERLRWVQAGAVTLTGALVGARLGYVAVHLSYYRAHPLEVLAFSRGGLFWPGAALGALLCLLAAAFTWGKSPLRVADGLAPALPPLALLTWLACWPAGIAYGMELPASRLYALPAPDEQGLMLARFPLQLSAAAVLLLLFALLEPLFNRLPRRGQAAAVTGLTFGLHTAFFTLFRADPLPTWQGLALELWGALAVLLLSLAAAIYSFWPRRAPKPGRVL